MAVARVVNAWGEKAEHDAASARVAKIESFILQEVKVVRWVAIQYYVEEDNQGRKIL